MKFKVHIKEEEREIEIKLNGADQREFLKNIKELVKEATSDQQDPIKVLELGEQFLVDYVNKLISEKAKIPLEDMDYFDLEDKKAVTEALRGLLIPGGDKGFF